MKIVICDDSIEDMLKMEKLLNKYSDSCPDIHFVLEKYSDSERLYQQIQKKEPADIYLLDMVMPCKDGIDIASLLRKLGDESVIIYITSSEDYALESYQVHAARYLLKPVRESDFFEALDFALSLTESKKRLVYPVKTKDGLISVPYSKIEYIENVSRTLDVHLTDGTAIRSIFIRKSFDQEIAILLESRNFIQVHKSFLINLKFVSKLMPDNILMESGKRIPVSKTRAPGVKKDYLLFVSEQY